MTSVLEQQIPTCDGCGKPGSVGKFNHSKYCPDCNRQNVLYLGAMNALHLALAEVTATWEAHWQTIGLTTNETHGILEGVNLTKLDD